MSDTRKEEAERFIAAWVIGSFSLACSRCPALDDCIPSDGQTCEEFIRAWAEEDTDE